MVNHYQCNEHGIDPRLMNKAMRTVIREGRLKQSRRAFRVIMFLLLLGFVLLAVASHHAKSEPRCSNHHPCSVQDYLAPVLGNLNFWIRNPYARRVELRICANPKFPADLPRMRNCNIARRAERISAGTN